MSLEENLVDVLWEDRPPHPHNEVFSHPIKYTGKLHFHEQSRWFSHDLYCQDKIRLRNSRMSGENYKRFCSDLSYNSRCKKALIDGRCMLCRRVPRLLLWLRWTKLHGCLIWGVSLKKLKLESDVFWCFFYLGSDVLYNPVFMAYAVVTQSTTILWVSAANNNILAFHF